jgi:hypothetical protein
MFFTFPSFEYVVPRELKQAGETRWRTFEHVGQGFFVAVMTLSGDPPEHRRTLLMTWDSDLVHMLESPKTAAALHSLHHLSPWQDGAGKPVYCEVREIWRGVDRDADNVEVITFKTADGTAFCGQDAIPVPPSVRQDCLLVTIGPR